MTTFTATIPVLPALNMKVTLAFYEHHLAFKQRLRLDLCKRSSKTCGRSANPCHTFYSLLSTFNCSLPIFATPLQSTAK
jgi:hypothetical protein